MIFTSSNSTLFFHFFKMLIITFFASSKKITNKIKARGKNHEKNIMSEKELTNYS